jgi:hypothetical protein
MMTIDAIPGLLPALEGLETRHLRVPTVIDASGEAVPLDVPDRWRQMGPLLTQGWVLEVYPSDASLLVLIRMGSTLQISEMRDGRIIHHEQIPKERSVPVPESASSSHVIDDILAKPGVAPAIRSAMAMLQDRDPAVDVTAFVSSIDGSPAWTPYRGEGITDPAWWSLIGGCYDRGGVVVVWPSLNGDVCAHIGIWTAGFSAALVMDHEGSIFQSTGDPQTVGLP